MIHLSQTLKSLFLTPSKVFKKHWLPPSNPLKQLIYPPPPPQNKKLGRPVATSTFPHHCLYCRMMPGTRTGMTTPPGKTLKIDINIIRNKQGDKSCHPRDFDSLTTYQIKFVFFLILLLNFHLWQLHFHFIVLSMTTDQISIKDGPLRMHHHKKYTKLIIFATY